MFRKIIAAIATPQGKGGIAIIRLSGEGCLSVAKKMFTPKGKTPVEEFEPCRMYMGTIDGQGFCDYGFCIYFRAPRSYTGEDVVEFQCHGGESMARGILSRAFELGAYPAGRGEFTKRAFLNGKLSLASAEGVADMINGDSEAEIRAGYFLYSEKLTEKVKACQDVLKNVLAGIDASIDYPEEDVEEERTEETALRLRSVLTDIQTLLLSYSKGKKIKTGVTVAICGKPNTGKSSLLNRLIGYDKAIVSEIAGTTRDAVEGCVEIEGVKFNLYDTAGLREGQDEIEKVGIDKATKLIETADICVFVSDGATGADEEDGKILSSLQGKKVITVVNKTDLMRDETETDADVMTSAITGEGIMRLRSLLYERGVGARSEDAAFLVEERHYERLKRAKELLEEAIRGCGKDPLDLVGIGINEAWETLGEITGETASEAVVDEIFSKFCVGK